MSSGQVAIGGSGSDSLIRFIKRDTTAGTFSNVDSSNACAQWKYNASTDELILDKKTENDLDQLETIMKVTANGNVEFEKSVSFKGGSTNLSSNIVTTQAERLNLGINDSVNITSVSYSNNTYTFTHNTVLSTTVIGNSWSLAGSGSTWTTSEEHNLEIGDRVLLVSISSGSLTNYIANAALSDVFTVVTAPTSTTLTLSYLNSSGATSGNSVTNGDSDAQTFTFKKYDGFVTGDYVYISGAKNSSNSTYYPISGNTTNSFSNTSAYVSASNTSATTFSVTHININGTNTSLDNSTVPDNSTSAMIASRLTTFSSETGIEILGIKDNNSLIDGSISFDTNDSLNVENTSGAIGIGTNAVTGAINLGTSATARTITLGNASSTKMDINALVVEVDSVNALELNSSSGAISIGNDDVDQNINIGTQGERTVNISTGAFAHTVNVGNATGATAVNVTTGSGGLTMTTGTNGNISIDPHGTGNLTLGSADNTTTSLNGNAMNLDSAGALQINSSAGAISIGNDDIDQAINIGTQGERTISIGTGAFADTINVGNATGATAVSITSGTGSIALASTGSGDITIDSDDTLLLDADGVLELNSSAGQISIGNDDVDQNINIGTQGERTISIGTGAFADTINLGNATGATAVSITSGTGSIALASTGSGDITIDSDDTLLLDSDGVLELNSSAGEISIGNDDVDQNINIGTQGERTVNISTGAFAHTVNVGNATGATAVNVTTGSGGLTMTTGTNGNISIDPHGTGNLTLGSLDNTTTSLSGEVIHMNTGSAGVILKGTTPKLTIGDAGAEDTFLVFDGNLIDYRIGLDDGTDKLELGVGSTHGTTTAMTIDSSQQVMVTTTTQSTSINTGALLVSGGMGVTKNVFVGGDVTCIGTCTASDLNLKTDINNITDAKTTLNKIRPVNYRFKSDIKNRSKMGVIAQEIFNILPDLVHSDTEGMLSVDYTSLISLLVKGFQEQQVEISQMQQRINTLENYSISNN